MKKLLLLGLCFISVNTLYAEDFAKLRIRISDPTADNRYFLCVGNVGCISIKAGDQGQSYPMTAGKIESIATTNMITLRLYNQALPASCRVSVNVDQTVTISGNLVKKANNDLYINHLNCKVSV